MSDPERGLLVLQVTDTHLFPSADGTLLGVCTQDSLEAVLDQAFGERTPDVVVASGDLAQVGTDATYRRFAETLGRRYDGATLCVPGNHDIGRSFAAALATDAVTLGGWTLLGVDTHVDDRVGGHIAPAELERVAKRLADGGGFFLVVGHHAPVDVGTSWLDSQRIDNGDALVELMCRHAVGGYVFGHVHQEFERRVGSLRLLATPSTCFQFRAGTPEFAIDNLMPGYRWLELGADGEITTEVVRLDNFDLTLDLTDTKY